MKYRNIQNERIAFGQYGMTQPELGQLIGKTGAVISNIENGKTPLLLEEAIAFAKHFDFSLDWFIYRDVPRNNHKRDAVVADVLAALPRAIEKGDVVVEKYVPDWAAGNNLAQALRNRHNMSVQEALNFVLKKLDSVTQCPESSAVKNREYVFDFAPICHWDTLDRSWREAFCNGLKNYGFSLTLDTTSNTLTVRW